MTHQPPPPGPPHPAPAARPAPSTSLRGPVWLTASGAVLVLATVVVAVLVARTFVGLLPTDLLDADGGPGPGVVATLGAPGTATADLEADTRYVVLVAQDAPATDRDGDAWLADLEDDLLVRTPDGRTLEASLSPGVHLSSSRGGTSVHSVGAFRTGAAGEHVLEASPLDDGAEGRVLVAVDEPFLPFFTGIFGTVFGVFAGILTALLGVPMVVVGIVWWRRRSSARRAARTAGATGATGATA